MPLTGSHLELIETEILPGSPAAGKAVRSLKLPEGSLIGGIVRGGKVVPGVGEAILQSGDRVIVFAPTVAEAEVRKTLFG
jgi:trk system potassium uptake protein TrkA